MKDQAASRGCSGDVLNEGPEAGALASDRLHDREEIL